MNSSGFRRGGGLALTLKLLCFNEDFFGVKIFVFEALACNESITCVVLKRVLFDYQSQVSELLFLLVASLILCFTVHVHKMCSACEVHILYSQKGKWGGHIAHRRGEGRFKLISAM